MHTTNFMVKTAKRLKTIAVFAGNGNKVRAYKLVYDTDPSTSQSFEYSGSTGRSLLTSVQQFGNDFTLDSETSGTVTGGTSLPAVKFTWKDSVAPALSGTFPENYNWTSTGKGINYSSLPADFNGDGNVDIYMFKSDTGDHIVWLNNGQGGFDTGSFNWTASGKGTSYSVLLGDFNGDGTSDIYLFKSSTGEHKVWLNDGHGNFNTQSFNWEVSGKGTDFSVSLADFDGNGKSDIYLFKSDTGEHKVWLNDGQGRFDPDSLNNWESSGKGNNFGVSLGDFNGDGKPDIYMNNLSSHIVWLNDGDGRFTATASTYWEYTPSFGAGYIPLLADFNGDGKSDIYMFKSSTGDHIVWLGNGDGTFPSSYKWRSGEGYKLTGTLGYKCWPPFAPGCLWNNVNNTRVELGDFNGDGLTDIFMFNASTLSGSDYVVWMNNGSTSFPNYNPELNLYNAFHNVTVLGDFNGDAKADIYIVDPPTGRHNVWINQGAFPDLLSSISNGIGGTTTISYTPSTQYTNTQLPFPVQTVSSVTTNDGNGNISESTYQYEGGFFHIGERDFRGFNDVTVTGPVGPNGEQTITETWFHQGTDIGVDQNIPNVVVGYMKGKPYRTRVMDGSRNVYSDTTISYLSSTATNSTYFNPPDTVTSITCNGDSQQTCDGVSSGQSMKKKYISYDEFGNLEQEQIFSSVDASTPYRITTREFTTDGDNYIVGLIKNEVISDGTGSVLSEATYYYDGPNDCVTESTNQRPTQGNLTMVKRTFDGVNDPKVKMGYEYGNVICTSDALGHVSDITYDTATKTYAVSKQSPTIQATGFRLSTTTNYYGVNVPLASGVYGQVQSIEDANGQTTSFEYDALGRKTKVIDPYGTSAQNGTVSYSYNDASRGIVGEQHVTTTATTNYTTGATIWSEVYFDGFGRTIKNRSKGPNNTVIRTDTAYDGRGAVSWATLPYSEGTGTVPTQTFKYDAIGRVKEGRTPDGKVFYTCYSNGVTGTLDPDGHKKIETRDVFGRLVQVDEYAGLFSSCSTDVAGHNSAHDGTTIYQYDVLGNLVLVRDPEENQTRIYYDALGRKDYMIDPDMGTWDYSYDPNNNLIAQEGPNGAEIRFHYDELNRLYWKEYVTKQPLVMTDVYYSYDAAPDNSAVTYPKGRLSTVSDASGSTKFYYDKVGRTTQTTKLVDNNPSPLTYDFLASYDALGRPTGITYPDSDVVNYIYDASVLSSVTGSDINYATFTNYKVSGPETVTYGNGITTGYAYDPSTYHLKSIVTGNANQPFINLSYEYYNSGNLHAISDHTYNGTRSQILEYDGLNRLQQAQLAKGDGSHDVYWYDYTPSGNIQIKEGVTYDYVSGTSGGPHAVKKTLPEGRTYEYDLNGNMITESVQSNVFRTINYDYDNMPQSVIVSNTTTTFVYDGAGSRVKKITSSGGNIYETVYLGKLYECRETICTKYIFAGGARIAMKTGTEILYYHQDHLGSTLAVTDSIGNQTTSCSTQPVRIDGATPQYFDTLQAAYNAASDGAVIQARAQTYDENLELNSGISATIRGGYDCGFTSQVGNSELVGRLSDNSGTLTIENFEIVITGYAKNTANDIQYLPFGATRSDTGYLSATHKYTSQEFDEETGLYNYNARFYSPSLGRFISADSIVPDPSNPQSLNRYSYVINNPLLYTDPSGHSFWKRMKKWAKKPINAFIMQQIPGLHELGTYFLTRSDTGQKILIAEAVIAATVASAGAAGAFDHQYFLMAAAEGNNVYFTTAAQKFWLGFEEAAVAFGEAVAEASPYLAGAGGIYIVGGWVGDSDRGNGSSGGGGTGTPPPSADGTSGGGDSPSVGASAQSYGTKGLYPVYNAHGQLIDAPLEKPLIDPIDLLAGGVISGPAGPLFGRAVYRNGSYGLFNRGLITGNKWGIGWSWDEGRNWFGIHWGTYRNPSHGHLDLLPGPGDYGGSRWGHAPWQW